jgi:hypothetical protein
MPRQARDFAAEYRRRIARGLYRGLSKAQARGHARRGEKSPYLLRQPSASSDQIQTALRSLQRGESLSASARTSGIQRDTLRRILVNKKLLKKDGRRWVLHEHRPRRMLIFTNREARYVVVSRKTASTIGRYLAAVRAYLTSGQRTHLSPFVGKSISDINGVRYFLETGPNALHRLNAAGSERFEDVYQFVF